MTDDDGEQPGRAPRPFPDPDEIWYGDLPEDDEPEPTGSTAAAPPSPEPELWMGPGTIGDERGRDAAAVSPPVEATPPTAPPAAAPVDAPSFAVPTAPPAAPAIPPPAAPVSPAPVNPAPSGPSPFAAPAAPAAPAVPTAQVPAAEPVPTVPGLPRGFAPQTDTEFTYVPPAPPPTTVPTAPAPKPRRRGGRLLVVLVVLLALAGAVVVLVSRSGSDEPEATAPVAATTTTPAGGPSTTATEPSEADPAAPWAAIEPVDLPHLGGGGNAAVGHGSLWLADILGGQVLRVDPETAELQSSIAVDAPAQVAVTDSSVWVFEDGMTGKATRLDPTTNQLGEVVTFEDTTGQVYSDGDSVWVPSFTVGGAGQLDRLDDASGTVTRVARWDDFAITGAQGVDDNLWVFASDGPYRIDEAQHVAEPARTRPLGQGNGEIADPSSFLWYAELGESIVHGIDPEAREERWREEELPNAAGSIVATTDSVWVLSADGESLTRFMTDVETDLPPQETHTTGAPYNSIALVGDDLWLIGGDGRHPVARLPLDT